MLGPNLLLSLHPDYVMYHIITPLKTDKTLISCGWLFSEGVVSSKKYNLSESFVLGTKKAFGTVFLNIRAFGKMFSGDIDPSKNLSGPIGIAQIFGSEWDWGNFWRIVGLLSMVLAFMNLLPIPALDGGHATFILYEMVSGKKPTEKFLEYSTRFGVIILLGLMSYVILLSLIHI